MIQKPAEHPNCGKEKNKENRYTKSFLILRFLIRLLIKKPVFYGLDNVDAEPPSVFVSNHLGYYAPLKLMIFSKIPFYPWVAYEVTDKKYCKKYLLNDFVEPSMKLKAPLSGWVAGWIARACLYVMKSVGAIPVYRRKRSIIQTLDQSAEILESGGNLLIFPEKKDQAFSPDMNRFHIGFPFVAKAYYKRCHKKVDFYPVCVDRKRNRITFGRKITYNPDNPFYFEKIRIVEEIENAVSEMFKSSSEGK